MVSTDRDLLLRLVLALENISKSLEIKAEIMDHRGNIMKDVNEMDPKFFEAAERVINTPEERINIAHPNPNINMITTRETKPNGTIVQEITEVKESRNFVFGTIKFETEKSYLMVNAEGLIKWVAKSIVIDKKYKDNVLIGLIVADNKKWIIDEPWKEDAYK